MTEDPGSVLREAREMSERDPDGALERYRRVASAQPGPEWSEAQVELVIIAFRHWELAEVKKRCELVLSASNELTTLAARAAAGVYLNQAREHLEETVDDAQLERARQECEQGGDHYLASLASGVLANVRAGQGDRGRAKDELLRAERNYAQAGSMLGGPGALHRLARMEMDGGDVEAARGAVRRGLEYLKQFPYGGMNVRRLTEKLQELERAIDALDEGEP